MERILIPRKTTAETIGVSLRMVDVLIKKGILDTKKIGRRTLVTRVSIERLAK